MFHDHGVELTEQRVMVGLGEQLLDQKLHDLTLGIRIRLAQHAAQHSALAIDIGVERRPIDNDGGRQQMAFEDAAGRKGERDARRRRQLLTFHVRDMKPLEREAHRLAESAPFQRYVLGGDPELASGRIERGSDARLQEVEIDRPRQQPQRHHGHEHRDGDDNAYHDAFEQPISSSYQYRYFH